MTMDPSLYERGLWIANSIFHQILAIIVVYILWTIGEHYDSDSSFTWHMVLSTLGYLFFMIEGITLFVEEYIYAVGIQRKTRLTVHGIFMGLGVLSSTIGISLMINKKGSHATHFSSTHGALGLTAWIFALLNTLLGVGVRFFPTKMFIRPVLVKLIHIVLGLSSILFGLITVGYGLNKLSFKAFSTDNTVLAACILIGLLGLWSFYDSFKSIYNSINMGIKALFCN